MSAVDPTEGPIPLWLDCDPGHDDAFAILLAAHHPAFNLLGVSTVHGNASLERTTRNAGSVLTAIGKGHIPIYPGAAKPFCRNSVHAPDIHGSTGLDGTDLLPQPSSPPIISTNAITAMRDALVAEHNAWLVATGALTNVALLFATFPDLVGRIKGLSIMGGAIGGSFTDAPLGHVKGEGERFGNTTPWAEFNIYCDPEAAQKIFSDPVLAAKTTLIPLDVSHLVLGTEDVREQLFHGFVAGQSPSSIVRPLFHDILMFFAKTYADVFGITAGPPLHDPIAVAVLLDQVEGHGLYFDDRDGEKWRIHIVTDGLHSELAEEHGQLGRTIATKAADGEGGVRIPRGLNVRRFWDLLDQCLRRAELDS